MITTLLCKTENLQEACVTCMHFKNSTQGCYMLMSFLTLPTMHVLLLKSCFVTAWDGSKLFAKVISR